MYNSKVSDWKFYNSFTGPLIQKYPVISKALEDLRNLNADFVEMSGSGSTVFGVFSDSKSAETVFKKLCNDWQCCYCLLPFVS